MWDRLLASTRHEYTPAQRMTTLFFAGIFFVVVVPFVLVTTSAALDRWLGLPSMLWGWANMLAGVLLILAGWPLSMWAIYIQFTLGRGTPVPLMATQRLIITGPYLYCRNPMALGAFIAYFGVAVWLGSTSAIGLALLFPALLLPYIRVFEEREMEARFGEEYLEYKRRTPFIIPRAPKHSR